MKFQLVALLAAVGAAVAQGVTDKIAPKGAAPAGCEPTMAGKFEISIVGPNDGGSRALAFQNGAACAGDGVLVLQLAEGVLTDAHQRTGYIASNFQFQFDNPPQAGAVYTAGFSHCGNGSLALGGSAVFYQCRSGDFYNLYDRWWAEQCSPVAILVVPCGGGGGGGGTDGGEVSQVTTQVETVVGTDVITTTVVIPLDDGQPQVITTTTLVRICQIGDGQIQGHTTPCTAGATPPTLQSISIPRVSQLSDGQIQVTPEPSKGEPGDQPTVSATPTMTGPADVPTSAPTLNAAAPAADDDGAAGWTAAAVLLAGLGLGGVGWL